MRSSAQVDSAPTAPTPAPLVALAVDADEEQLHAIYPLPAEFPGVGGYADSVLGRYGPALIHVEELQPELLAPFTQLGEDDGDQVIPLRVHVARCRGGEEADLAVPIWLVE